MSSLLTCSICTSKFATVTKYREHLHKFHKGAKLFKCVLCTGSFEHKSSLNKHIKRKHETEQQSGVKQENKTVAVAELKKVCSPKATPSKKICTDRDRGQKQQHNGCDQKQENSDDRKQRTFSTNLDFQNVPYTKKANTFDQWLDLYQGVVQCTGKDIPMADTTKTRILRDVEKVQRQQPDLFDCVDDPVSFTEAVDAYIDRYFYPTIVITIRSIRWYMRYLLNTQQGPKTVSIDCLDDLDSTISEMQSVSTVNLANRSLLAITDPFHLARVVNLIVVTLCQHQRNVIDPFIVDFFRRREDKRPMPDQEVMINFGLDFRCFIELCIRYVNVPLRIQCTKDMRTWGPCSGDFVSKLVLHPTHFARNVLNDKTGKTAQTVSIPLCATISGYLMFYIKFCRARPDAPHVFQAKKGGRWTNASHDLKAYLTSKGVECEQFCSNGRFVHGSRHLSLALFSILCDFDFNSIRNYALLMRHSLSTIEYVYCPWLKLQQAKTASEQLFALKGIRYPSMAVSQKFKIARLLKPSNYLQEKLTTLLWATYSGLNSAMQTTMSPLTRNVSVQTDDSMLITHEQRPIRSKEHGVTPKTGKYSTTCVSCEEPTVLKGPYANRKKMDLFGRYFRECPTCKTNNFYPLGYTPANERSSSCKPRNLPEILKYICSQNKEV